MSRPEAETCLDREDRRSVALIIFGLGDGLEEVGDGRDMRDRVLAENLEFLLVRMRAAKPALL
jgi:hypothetical protein